MSLISLRATLRRLRSDSGLTTAETVLAAALLLMATATIGGFLISVSNGSVFAHGQSATLNNVRNTMQQIEKEVRGADSLVWCAPSGSCLQVGAQTALGGFRTVRYTHAGTELRREVFDDGSSTWGPARTIIERVANTGTDKVFACDTQSTLLRVTIDLHIEPTPSSNPTLHVQTSVRPRNFPTIASCP